MKINYPDTIEISFVNLEPGEIFSYKDEIILMKTKILTLANGHSVNAVSLEDGTFTRIDITDMVTPIEAELNVKGEKKI